MSGCSNLTSKALLYRADIIQLFIQNLDAAMILRYVICATASFSEDKSSKSSIIAYIIIILIINDYYFYIYVHAYLNHSSRYKLYPC